MLPEFTDPADRFMIEARSRSGGMGDIFKGTDQATGAPVAIKILRAAASPQERARFAREIAILADLRHPNIVQYIAHGTWLDGRLFFAMEWLDGEDLGQRQRRAPLGLRDSVEVVRRSAAAMAAIHARGVVHRDLKLSNIFLVRGKGTAIKLIDFGVVKLATPDDCPTERGTIIGTPHFMAPEQARGEPVDARADVYSLGSVLFRLVTGRNVFETEHAIALLGRLVLEDPPRAQQFRFDVPEALDEVITRAIARDREKRYENGGELARALARVGELNNDPPATDRSASAVRRAATPELRATPATPVGPSDERPQTRLATSERRVVACVLFELGAGPLRPEVDAALREVLGDDARLEPLLSGKMVAVLGVERSRGDEAMRAARAALTVARSTPGARVSVAVGHAVRGRANLAGEALERAAQQLESSVPGAVRIDGYATAALEGRFVVQEDARGGVLLHEDATGFDARKLLGRPSPTIGREHEVARLQGIFSDLAEDGVPRAALVTGPAGIGKSRVRAELIQRLDMAPHAPVILLCRGDPMSQGSGLSGLGRALRALMGIHDGERREDQVQKVSAHVATRLARPLRFLAAFIGELTGVPFPDDGNEPLRAARESPQLMESRMRMAIEAFFRSKSEDTPQILVIEDMHWADGTTIALVDWLLGCPDLRFGVFGFGRPELFSRFPALWAQRNVTRLPLSPLSPQAADRLVATALPQADPATRGAIVQRAGGYALFLEELIRHAAEGRDDVPLSVQALVQLRVDRMSKGVREALRAAAVFGQVFWTGGVEALLERPVGAELAELEAGEIIARQVEPRVAGQVQWTFRQALVRDAAYASIVEEDRAALHLAAAAWLESAGDVDPGLVARHAEAGGDKARAALLYARATRGAAARGAALDAALDLATRGLACGAEGTTRATLLVHKGSICELMGRVREALDAAEEAARLALPGSDLWGEAQVLAATCLIEAGQSAEGDARAASALSPQFAAALSPSIRAMLLASRVRGLADLSRPAEALRAAEASVELARTSGSTDAVLTTEEARLAALIHVGDLSAAVAAGASLVAEADREGDVVVATKARLNTGSTLNVLGLFEEAQALLERALADARSRGLRVLEGFALHNLGMSYARLGNLEEGIACQRQADRLADACHVARLKIVARLYEAAFLVWRGAPGDYGTAHSIARWLCEETARHAAALQAMASFALARVQLARRELKEAVAAAREAARHLEGGPIEEWNDAIRLTLVEALLATGDEAAADAALDAAFTALAARVGALRDPRHREAFLRGSDDVGRLVALARERLGRSLPAPSAPEPPWDVEAPFKRPAAAPSRSRVSKTAGPPARWERAEAPGDDPAAQRGAGSAQGKDAHAESGAAPAREKGAPRS
ncbi:serine/threonine-protein kinase [Sorangium sp. So ce513]|uniref:serine/threonine-protein kinase n=1 Tax=Sorangium sp. So ce513 TaxID=3133315 RepID=UPI003F63D351